MKYFDENFSPKIGAKKIWWEKIFSLISGVPSNRFSLIFYFDFFPLILLLFCRCKLFTPLKDFFIPFPFTVCSTPDILDSPLCLWRYRTHLRTLSRVAIWEDCRSHGARKIALCTLLWQNVEWDRWDRLHVEYHLLVPHGYCVYRDVWAQGCLTSFSGGITVWCSFCKDWSFAREGKSLFYARLLFNTLRFIAFIEGLPCITGCRPPLGISSLASIIIVMRYRISSTSAFRDSLIRHCSSRRSFNGDSFLRKVSRACACCSKTVMCTRDVSGRPTF